VHFGYPVADSLVGLGITATILVIVWNSARTVVRRALDGVEPNVVQEIRHAATHVEGVKEVSEVRARWLGHTLLAEVNIAVDPKISVEDGHRIADAVQSQLSDHLKFLARSVVHVDPLGNAGESFHRPGGSAR